MSVTMLHTYKLSPDKSTSTVMQRKDHKKIVTNSSDWVPGYHHFQLNLVTPNGPELCRVELLDL